MKLKLHSTLEAGPAGSTRPPIVILHGLFGSSRNWTSIAKLLAETHDAYALDQRNHGDSPHADSHTLKDLRDDLQHWIAEQNFAKAPIIIGHSMGGMAAMAFALEYPEALSGLIVVDIAPREYPPHHSKEFEALSIDVSQCASRSDVDRQMQAIISDRMVRQFLQMNLERQNDDGYAWKINVSALKNATHTRGLENAGAIVGNATNAAADQAHFAGPALFLRGGESDYIRDEDFGEIKRLFPGATIQTVAGHGHWLHYSAQDEFMRIVQEFLATQEPA